MLEYDLIFDEPVYLILGVAETCHDARSMLAEHGAGIELGKPHSLASEAGANDLCLAPVLVFHIVNKAVFNRLRVGEDVAVAVEDLAAESLSVEYLKPLLRSLCGEYLLKALHNRLADLDLIKVGSGSIARIAYHVDAAEQLEKNLMVACEVDDLRHEPAAVAALVGRAEGAGVLTSLGHFEAVLGTGDEDVRKPCGGTVQAEGYSVSLAGLAENPIELGEKEYFLLGDNRDSSEDSRFVNIGNVKEDQIVGKVWFRIFPLINLGLIRTE